jgi:epoxyqueuosine reductase
VLKAPLRALVTSITALAPHARCLSYSDTGPILERDAAQRAGIGFIGKHTNLISRSLGNWILLAEILTDLPLPPDAAERNRCGSCTRCIAACPTAAIVAPFELDARKCISYLTIECRETIPLELRPLIGHRVFGCDDCLAACPWNRFAQAARVMAPAARPDLAQLNLCDVLNLSESEFVARFAGTPIIRTKRRGLIRNACVALGNVGETNALALLERTAATNDTLIAEHARWAIDQIVQRARAGKTQAGGPTEVG